MLVLLHGYGGSGVFYYKMLKKLAEKFNVLCLDIIGMGASSRSSDFNKKDEAEEMIEYFTRYIDKWRQRLGLKSFYLAGHSFGGYIAGCYTVKFP